MEKLPEPPKYKPTPPKPPITSHPSINLNPPIPALKRIEDKTKVNIRYPLIYPYAFAHIYWNPQIGELVYDVEEPALNEYEKRILNLIKQALQEIINIGYLSEKSQEEILGYIDKSIKLISQELSLDIPKQTYPKIFYYIYRDFIGFNEIEPLLRDYFIEDIECNGVNSPVYIVHRIYRNMRTNIVYRDMNYLASFVEKLAQRCGKYISYANPLLDGTLPDGSRVNATYTTEITSKGPTFTIRKFTKIPWSPIQLINFRTVSPEMMAYLWILIQHKLNVLITGGTGSGKTTLLNAIAFFIPPEARVVSIEDSVLGDTEILVKKNGNLELIKISELAKMNLDSIEVLTLDRKNYKLKFKKPKKIIKHKTKKDIYEILTSSGRLVRVTKDHSIFTLTDDGLKEIKPTELNEGSFIACPRRIPFKGKQKKFINLLNYLDVFKDDFIEGKPISKIFKKYKRKDLRVKKERYRWWKKRNIIPIKIFKKLDVKFSFNELKRLKIKSKYKSRLPIIFPITKNFLELVGLWLGDGSYDNYNKNRIIISNSDKECLAVVKKFAKDFNFGISKMNDKVSLSINSTLLYKLFKHVIKLNGYSSSKRIPPFIFNLSNDQLKHVLRGYFSADGSVKSHEVSCYSQSYGLLRDIQTLLLRLNILSRITSFERKDKCMTLSISSYDNIKKFKEIGFLQKRKNIRLLEIKKRAHHTCTDIVPLTKKQLNILNRYKKISWPYLKGMQNIGREYLRRIAPKGTIFNDLAHSDIFWDRVKRIRKLKKRERYVYDISVGETENFIGNNIVLHNTRELNLPRENWLPSVARTGLGGIGEVDLFTLLKESFRQRPDYVIVGEVRGKEAFVLFQGMASGHASISTIHADSVEAVIKRLQTPPINLSPTLLNVLDVVAIMQHAIVKGQETRKLAKIVEIVNVSEDGTAITNVPFLWNPADDKFYYRSTMKSFEKISRRYGLSMESIINEFKIRTRLLYSLYAKRIFDFYEVQKIVNLYYKNKQEVLRKFL